MQAAVRRPYPYGYPRSDQGELLPAVTERLQQRPLVHAIDQVDGAAVVLPEGVVLSLGVMFPSVKVDEDNPDIDHPDDPANVRKAMRKAT